MHGMHSSSKSFIKAILPGMLVLLLAEPVRSVEGYKDIVKPGAMRADHVRDAEDGGKCGKVGGKPSGDEYNNKAWLDYKKPLGRMQLTYWLQEIHKIVVKHDITFGYIKKDGEVASDSKLDDEKVPTAEADPELNSRRIDLKHVGPFQTLAEASSWIETCVKEMMQQIPGLQGAVRASSDRIDTLETNLGSADGRIKALEEDNRQSKSDIIGLGNAANSDRARIVQLEGDNKTLQQQLGEQTQKFTALERRFKKVDAHVTKMINMFGGRARGRASSFSVGGGDETTNRERRRLGSIAERLARQNQMP